MKSSLITALILALGTGCAARLAAPVSADVKPFPTPQATANVKPETVAGAGDETKEAEAKESEVPAEFRGADFKNFSYPYSGSKRLVRLVDGKQEFYEDKELGNGWFDLKDVYYADLTGDGRAEAIVQLSAVLCGGSCDGGSNLFYFYSARGSGPKLLWRIETGSLGYGCGLKSFAGSKGSVVIEVFKKCRLDGETFVSENEQEPGEPVGHIFKFSARSITRFLFEFEGRRFALKKREVFPNPQQDVKNYSSSVSISDE